MKRTILTLLSVLLTMGAWAAIAQIDSQLQFAAREALPSDLSTNDVYQLLQSGLWNSTRTAVAVSLPVPKASVIFVFKKEVDGKYRSVDISRVEDGNFGKVGISGRAGYDRYETTPIEWLHRDNGSLEVVMRTRAWKAGQRYTVSEALYIKADGTVSWR